MLEVDPKQNQVQFKEEPSQCTMYLWVVHAHLCSPKVRLLGGHTLRLNSKDLLYIEWQKSNYVASYCYLCYKWML